VGFEWYAARDRAAGDGSAVHSSMQILIENLKTHPTLNQEVGFCGVRTFGVHLRHSATAILIFGLHARSSPNSEMICYPAVASLQPWDSMGVAWGGGHASKSRSRPLDLCYGLLSGRSFSSR
jgi:hypothetical protein